MSADNRPSWDEYFMGLANQVAERTTCLRRGVGAIIVKDRRILATGYNGVPTGLAHCSETGCLRQQLGVPSGQRHEICRGLHAEQNAIIQAARQGDGQRLPHHATDFLGPREEPPVLQLQILCINHISFLPLN